MDSAIICIHAYHVYDLLSIFYTSISEQKYLSWVTINYFLPEQLKQGSVNPSSTHISFHLLNHFNGTPNCGRVILLAAWKHTPRSASKTDDIKITIFGETLQKEYESLLGFCHSFSPHWVASVKEKHIVPFDSRYVNLVRFVLDECFICISNIQFTELRDEGYHYGGRNVSCT